MKPLIFSENQLCYLLPRHLLLDNNLEIISAGNEIISSIGNLIGTPFLSNFFLANCNQSLNFKNLKGFDNSEIELILCNAKDITLKCKISFFENAKQFLLVIDNKSHITSQQKLKKIQPEINLSTLDNALEQIGHTFWFHDLDNSFEFIKNSREHSDYGGFYNFFDNDSKRLFKKIKVWLSSIHPDDFWMIHDADKAYRNGRIKSHNLEYRIVDSKGENRWISDKGIVYTYKTGIPKTVICLHTDITEFKNARLELDKQKKFYETILNNLPADIAVFDKNHTYLFVNPSGIKNEEIRQWIIGKKDEDYIKLRNLSKSVLEERRNNFNDVKLTLKAKSWEQEIIKPDGTKEYILRIFQPYLNANGDFELMIGYGINITEQKLIEQKIAISEAKYRILIDKSLTVITKHDMQGVFTMANPVIEDVLGYPINEIIGNHITLYMHKKDAEIVNANYLQTIRREKTAKGILRFIHKNGNIRYILYNNYLVENTHDEPYVISHKVDITDRVEAEEKLTTANKQIKKESLAKERFLANMSHELRTPMNGIVGLINFLEKTRLSSKQKKYIELTKGSINSLLVTLNEVLDIEKIIAGKLELEKIPFNVSESIATIVESEKYRTEEKHLIIDINDTLQKHQLVLGDPYRLGQIVLNLVSNAIKFTNYGDKITVNVNEVSSDDKTLTVEISVTDTGIGFAKSQLKTIFEPFTQAELSITRKYGGSGLGLSICKHLIELHGGTITADSIEGKGSTFIFTITYQKILEKYTVKKNDVKYTLKKSKILKGTNVLIAEDVEVNQYILKNILTQWGCNVMIAENGREAVEAVNNQSFDLIFMDIQMPIMDGFEATKIIRNHINKQKATTPIIAVTANTLKDIIKNFVKYDLTYYILKPYNEDIVFEIAEKLIKENTKHKIATQLSTYNTVKHKRIANGDKKFMTETAEIFVRTAPINYSLMLDALQNKDWLMMAKEAHKLKFSLDFFGMQESAQLLADIEYLITTKKHVLKIKNLTTMFGKQLEASIIQLKNNFLN